jgi:hypothetical protein
MVRFGYPGFCKPEKKSKDQKTKSEFTLLCSGGRYPVPHISTRSKSFRLSLQWLSFPCPCCCSRTTNRGFCSAGLLFEATKPEVVADVVVGATAGRKNTRSSIESGVDGEGRHATVGVRHVSAKTRKRNKVGDRRLADGEQQ